jgi:hypothetical protein
VSKLAEKLNAVEITKTALCGVGRLLQKSDDEDRAAILRLLDSKDRSGRPCTSGRALALILAGEGITGCGETAIRDHRVSECACAKNKP